MLKSRGGITLTERSTSRLCLNQPLSSGRAFPGDVFNLAPYVLPSDSCWL